MDGSTLLLISDNSEDHEFATHLARTTEQELSAISHLQQLSSQLDGPPVSTVLFDASSASNCSEFERWVKRHATELGKAALPERIHYLSPSPEHLCTSTFMFQSGIAGNFICRNFNDTEESARHYSRIVRASLRPRTFGLSNLLLSPNSDVWLTHFEESIQKGAAAQAVESYMKERGGPSRTAQIVVTAVDELLMNAIFEAPADGIGRPIFGQTPRTTNLKLTGKQAVEMGLVDDGDYVGISVLDHVGSLQREAALEHLARSYRGLRGPLPESSSPQKDLSGLGLAYVFKSGGSLVFTSAPGDRTEVSVFFRKVASVRKFKEQFQFVATRFF